ncbi:glutamine amidotransferase family protein [Thermatribacter velox]|uniref:Glutamine amidotransferase family protein n=1 Tax=Thermatribacter velox TaxID=3039681 RepID=A0ABZ2YCX6_9BACT
MKEVCRVPSGCAVVGILNRDGKLIDGEAIIKSIAVMHERSNGLGGGFAAYGIYPQYAELYAFHVLYDNRNRRGDVENLLREVFVIEHQESIPLREIKEITDYPYFERYFLRFRGNSSSEEDEVVKVVMKINAGIDGAYVISSGKNMGIFKGVGYPEDVGRLFRLEEYKGYCWIAHGRFPTNSVGWWGGAHPFGLLSWSVVHNGEISSYGINRRYLQNFGYYCNLQTDTEVIAYLVDLFVRKQGVPMSYLGAIFASPFWVQIERMEEPQKSFYRAMRINFGGALLNGPFSIIVGFDGGMFGMVDRIKLRPMVAAWKGATFYLSSEECAIREIQPDLDLVVPLRAGEVILGKVGEESLYGQKLAVS